MPAPGRALDVGQLLAHCARCLPRNLVPCYVQRVDEIPKTASEKPLERVLREQLEHELAERSVALQQA
jgi:crotonobetaine/carnitine-CoA ligase